MAILATCAQAITFNKMKFSQDIDLNALQATQESLKSTNQVLIIGTKDTSASIVEQQNVQNANGIVFDIHDEGDVKFVFQDSDILGNPLDRVLFNGRSLRELIQDEMRNNMQVLLPGQMTNLVLNMTHNPLWGKKLAVIGDSLISAPTKATSYPSYIA